MGKSGVLEHKSGNIPETRKDRGYVTMEDLWKLAYALSNGTIPDPLRPPLPQDWGFATPKFLIDIISGMGKATGFKFGRYINRVHPNKSPLKYVRKESMGISSDPTPIPTPNFGGVPVASDRPCLAQPEQKP